MQLPHALLNENEVFVLVRAIRSRIGELEILSRTLGCNYDEELKTLDDMNNMFTDVFQHTYGRVDFND